MKKKKEVRRIVVLSALAALGFGSVAVGSTYALFTSESKTNVTVASGKVDVESTITDLVTYSGKDLTGNSETDKDNIVQTSDGNFTNGGIAKLTEAGDLELADVTPGDKVTFKIKVKNNSTVAIKYRTVITCEEDDGLLSGLKFTIGSSEFDGLTNKSNWESLSANTDFTSNSIDCSIFLPTDAGNEYQGKTCKVSYSLEAVQGNAKTTDPDANIIEIDNAAQLGAFRDIVNKKSIDEQKAAFNGKTIKLTNTIDLKNQKWTPIGWNSKKSDGTDYNNEFKATFDGNGYTIKNFSVSKLEQRCTGFFSVGHYLTIKDLTIDNATIEGANSVGGIVGFGYGMTITGCKVTNSKLTASTWKNPSSSVKDKNPEGWDDGDKVGAIAGALLESGHTVTKCTATGNTITGYRDVGGLVGIVDGISNSVTSNTISSTEIYNDRTHDYKKDLGEFKKDSDYNVNDVVGRKSEYTTLNSNNTSDVTINIKNSI